MASTRNHEVPSARPPTAPPPFEVLTRTPMPAPGVIGLVPQNYTFAVSHSAFSTQTSTPVISQSQVQMLALRKVYARPAWAALTLEEAKACSDLAYDGKESQASADGRWTIGPKGICSSWLTGFRAVLLTPTTPNDIRKVLAFAGTDSVADAWADIDQALSFNPILLPWQYAQASALASYLLGLHGARLRVTGHSLGGGLANFVSVKLAIPGAGVNAAPLGPGTRLHLLLFGKNDRTQFTHYNNDGEAVSSFAPGLQLGQRCQIESSSGVLAGHFLDNVNTNAPMVCYDDYLKRGSRGVTGTW